MHSNRSNPSQFRVSQSSVDSVDCIYSYTRRSFSYGKKYSDGTRRSVSYGKNYSEGYPKIFVTAVQLYTCTSTFRGARPIHHEDFCEDFLVSQLMPKSYWPPGFQLSRKFRDLPVQNKRVLPVLHAWILVLYSCTACVKFLRSA